MAKGRCLSCGSKVPMYAAVCPACGKQLTWNGPGVRVITATCPVCGRYTRSTSPTCEHCSSPINWQGTYLTQQMAKAQGMQAVGSGLQAIGCLLTVFVTIPVVLILVFIAC